jgi:uncharacterized protein YecE (DUF72 family)
MILQYPHMPTPTKHPIRVGTTSWTDKQLIDSGLFYPPEVKTAEARLRYYATQFPIVEVDSSYYALPSERNARLWAERTPVGFLFDVKAFRLFTQHQTPPEALPADLRHALGEIGKKKVFFRDVPEELREELWRDFRDALMPLKQAGKLGVVLFQFAPWFVYGRERLDHILACAEKLAGLRLAVEFRNKSWFGEHTGEVLAFERAHGLAHVIVDEPQGTSASIPAVWEVTCPEVAVLRLHGRNRETWQQKGLTAAERFNYLYNAAELSDLTARIRPLARQAEQTHVLFNNCYRNYAQRNALELQTSLAG